jgi:eukaryotic-like serine/threonine-protein kinase
MNATESRPERPPRAAAATRSLRAAPPRVLFSLSWKIFLTTALLIVLTVAVSVAVSTWRANEIANEAIQRTLSRTPEVFANFEDDRYEKLLRALRVVTNDSGFKALVAEADPATLTNSLREDLAAKLNASFLILTDARGVILARSDRKPVGRDLSRVPFVASALGLEDGRGRMFSDGSLFHAVASPVISGERTLNGVLVAAYAIDDSVANSLRDSVNGDVAFLPFPAQGHPGQPGAGASTLSRDRTREFLDAVVREPELVQAVFVDRKTIGPVRIETPHEAYVSVLLPLPSSSGDLIGAAVVAKSLSQELQVFAQIKKTIVEVGIAMIVLAFGLSYLISRRITEPVGRLVEAADRIREGEYDVEVPSESRDEIGALAHSFRQMVEELKGKAELEKYVASLTAPAPGDAITQALPAGSARPTGLPAAGSVFAGRYDIQSVLGQGGMGIVYKAHDRVLDEPVAIKLLRAEAVASDATLLDRFKQEIRLARKISHRNVLRTHDIGETDGLRYISMEYVKGLTLKQLIESDRLLPKPAALRIAKQICAGLAAAHAVGVVHRDIKPQNIMIEPSGGLKIMDFGIARLAHEKGMTQTGTVVGTPDYMSPEQARGGDLDVRSDIYSLGVVLYELFCGVLPFEADTPLGVVLKQIQEQPAPPEARNPQIDPGLARIVVKAMAKNPSDRYRSIAELHEDLSAVMA